MQPFLAYLKRASKLNLQTCLRRVKFARKVCRGELPRYVSFSNWLLFIFSVLLPRRGIFSKYTRHNFILECQPFFSHDNDIIGQWLSGAKPTTFGKSRHWRGVDRIAPITTTCFLQTTILCPHIGIQDRLLDAIRIFFITCMSFLAIVSRVINNLCSVYFPWLYSILPWQACPSHIRYYACFLIIILISTRLSQPSCPTWPPVFETPSLLTLLALPPCQIFRTYVLKAICV